MSNVGEGVLSPVPPGCVRARCFCTWWIAIPRHVTPPKLKPDGEYETDRRHECRICGVKLMLATQEDVDAVGLQIKEAPVEPERTSKGRKRKT